MPYAVENALFQWEEGERRLRETPALERPATGVLGELRRRLGSTFTLAELAELYAEDIDWALEVDSLASAGSAASGVVDAAFNRYAREAADYAGGRPSV